LGYIAGSFYRRPASRFVTQRQIRINAQRTKCEEERRITHMWNGINIIGWRGVEINK
jgi:hypothetical protein